MRDGIPENSVSELVLWTGLAVPAPPFAQRQTIVTGSVQAANTCHAGAPTFRLYGWIYRPIMSGHRSTSATILIGAALTGAIAGIGLTATTMQGRNAIVSTAHDIGVAVGLKRQRAPQAGDYWRGCNDARAVGTAPIYRGEPGYRSAMDGDDDGIACEPYTR